MIKDIRHITVFEHEKLLFNPTIKEEKSLHESLEKFYGSYSPFFTLIRNGVQFNEHVGVIQIGKTLIEVLPKADKNGEDQWRNLLVGMIKTILGFKVKETGNSDLRIRKNSILDLYFELFVREIETLLHKGLIKKYRLAEGNRYALKGNLQFSKHISQNLTHQERFFVKHSVYDVHHPLHCILYKALKLVSTLNTNQVLKSRIGSLLLNFPEMNDIKITESVFEKIVFDRKNTHYKTAITISKLILLNYHPDVSKGKNDVLALMFDMNLLWEQFIFVTLKRRFLEYKIISQWNKNFWKPANGANSGMRPDIVMQNLETSEIIVLDTKWKNLNGSNPSPEDLRQMYVYHRYFGAIKTALLYPGEYSIMNKGNYYSTESENMFSQKECSVIQISVKENIKDWQFHIFDSIRDFV